MCGIIGCIGNENAPQLIKNCLKKLEYRGYDSAGIANYEDIVKTINSVDSLDVSEINGDLAIGHTRWATHGSADAKNAQPHRSYTGETTVSHNGIITNMVELKKRFRENDHPMTTENDGQAICYLIEEELQTKPFKEAVFSAVKQLKGCFTFVVINKNNLGTLIVVKKGAPAAIGKGKNQTMVASDPVPLKGHAEQITYLEDGESAIISRDKIEFYNFIKSEPIEKEFIALDSVLAEISKEGYEHFMIKEIYEQIKMFSSIIDQDEDRIREAARMVQASPRVVLVACGTSRHAALVGRYIISKLTGKYLEVYMASEFEYFVDKIGKDALIIALSQSGETADVIEPLKTAKKNGVKIISVVNVPNSTIDRMSDLTFHMNCGPEISVASTKAFTAQVLVLSLLGFKMAYRYGQGLEMLKELPGKMQETLEKNEEKLKKIAKLLKNKQSMYYISRGENFAVAIEGSLKMKEISYIHAEGMPAGELKHGTIALVEEGTPVVVIAPNDYTYDETIANAEEVKARKGFIIGITDKENPVFDVNIKIPDVDPIFYPLLTNLPCQLLAYYTAIERGCNVDKPRNLAKSITVK